MINSLGKTISYTLNGNALTLFYEGMTFVFEKQGSGNSYSNDDAYSSIINNDVSYDIIDELNDSTVSD